MIAATDASGEVGVVGARKVFGEQSIKLEMARVDLQANDATTQIAAVAGSDTKILLLVLLRRRRHHRREELRKSRLAATSRGWATVEEFLLSAGMDSGRFCSRRARHSIAAQGGINATKDYANEGDSVHRLFVDTMKGGDFRAREGNVWRLAELSTDIIDQAVAQGVPFNREYGGLLATRSFGGVLVERTFYCRGQTGQQLLLGASGRLRQVADGQVRCTRATRCSTS